MNNVIIGTAGHIDHGKTTLLKALTGIDTDRFEEEKRRGISIDIGFAHMKLGPYHVGFVDVPGHEKFVKNMLAGIGGIHLVLLVVAADESVMPQTVEHFQICKLLEIPLGVITLTKRNLVETDLLPLVEMEVRELVRGSRLEQAPMVAVDSVSGEGIEELKHLLLQQIQKSEQAIAKRQRTHQVFRLPVDRVFTIRGFGTVVTGTPNSGSVNKGDVVTVYPAAKTARVRGIEIFNREAESAIAGQRTALNLAGVQKEELSRGMVISYANSLTPSHMLDAIVHLLPNSPQSLKQRSAIRFHHGSAELLGRVYPLEETELGPGDSMLAQIRLENPTVCCPKDHFILRRYSPMATIGGGVILDSHPEKHRKRQLDHVLSGLQKLWSIWQSSDPNFDSALVEYLVKLRGASGASLPHLVSRTGLLEEYLLPLLKDLDSLVLVPQEPLLAVDRRSLEELKEGVTRFLSDFHTSHPLAIGIPREELKGKFLGKATNSYFQFVLEQLESEKRVTLNTSTVSLYGKKVELTAEQEKVKDQLLKLIAERELRVPRLDELTHQMPYDPEQVRAVFYFLLKSGELVRISEDIVLSPDQIRFLKSRLKQSFPSGQTFSVAEFKDLFKITRKYAIPLLEFLDRRRITRRTEDKRLVL